MAAPLDAGRFLEPLPDPLLVVDSAGAIVFANGRAEDAFGYARGELEGQPVEVLVPDRFAHGHAVLRERFAASAVERPMGAGRELVARRKDGTGLSVEYRATPMCKDGAGVGAVVSFTDISEPPPQVEGRGREVELGERWTRERAETWWREHGPGPAAAGGDDSSAELRRPGEGSDAQM